MNDSGFTGELWSQCIHAHRKFGVNFVQGYGKYKGLCPHKNMIAYGSNSGHQAIGLAHLFGAERILLLGYDMMNGEKTHWFGDHPRGMQVPSPFSVFIENMNLLAKDAENIGLKIINCSRKTALKCFERKTIDECLK